VLACLPASDGVDANYGADRGRCFRISLFNNDAFKPPDALDGQTMMKFDDNAVININAEGCGTLRRGGAVAFALVPLYHGRDN